jgi:signal transduction histidine kinase
MALITNVLDLSRIEVGQLRLSPERHDLIAPMAEAMAMLKHDAERRRIQLRALAVPGVLTVYADPGRLRQVFLNLLSNALRFTPEEGMVEISAESESDWVAVHVRDTGIGIALKDQARIFAPFEQAAPALDSTRRGSGLGLTIAKTLVELHGGGLSLASEPGQGSTFSFRVPADEATFRRHVRAPIETPVYS